MAFDLTIGTERAQNLQNSIQDELTKRGYSPDADPVMAEYITIMLINNKTAEQITAELEDLIGASEYDASFTTWLFAEAARVSAPQSEPEAAVQEPSAQASTSETTKRESPPQTSENRRIASSGPRIYNAALVQALPSSTSGQKRTASARSPSPTGPNKARRMDFPPKAPRAMHGRDSSGGGGNRSLLERMGGRSRGGGPGHGHGRDEIQARIDAVTNGQGMELALMQQAQMNGFPNGMPAGMMMPDGGMGGGMGVNPLALQEMMMNQMALMAQMANSMGMLGQAGFVPPGAQMSPPIMNDIHGMGMDGQQGGHREGFRGGAPGRGGGRGGSAMGPRGAATLSDESSAVAAPTPQIVTAPSTSASSSSVVPAPSTSVSSSVATGAQPGFTPPSRPASPTLCKFGLKCTNALCRYAHPSPVATPESGVVLSNDACEAGRNCKDKDCIKAHVSPAAVGVQSVPVPAHVHKPVPVATTPQTPCRYGANCLRIHSGCPYIHPKPVPAASPANAHFNQQCRFGASCTRATCPFQHPPGRVLPTTFHRGLSTSTPAVTVHAPETGSIGAPSPHRSVVFNKPSTLGKKIQEAEKKVEGAEAAEVEKTIAPSVSATA